MYLSLQCLRYVFGEWVKGEGKRGKRSKKRKGVKRKRVRGMLVEFVGMESMPVICE